MILYIAEKPSLGRAIAEALPKPLKKSDGYITAANGDVVSWCIGHLLEQAEPDAYQSHFKQWKMEHLPILPEQWKLTPKPKTRKQLSVLRQLVKQAKQLVHAGDPDREGQLLVDEVISHLNVSQTKRARTQRLLINDLNTPAVRKALSNLQSNQAFIPLSVSALARSRADWLYGINMTRAYTLQGRKSGYQSVLSVGRVQTPILGLVVRRDEEIEHFQSKPFYEVLAQLSTDTNERFSAKWQPSEACQPYMDDEGRVLSKSLAENVIQRISHQPATVRQYSSKDRQQPQPLPYNLSSLQIDAAKRFKLSAQQTLDASQSLYEKHKLITYPRSDNRYLPQQHHAQAKNIFGHLIRTLPDHKEQISGADSQIKSNAWNDKKVEAHHAIIPTEHSVSEQALSTSEKQVFKLIVRQYLALFYPVHRYQERKAEIEIQQGLFKASSKSTIELGWKRLFNSKQDDASVTPASSDNSPIEQSFPAHSLTAHSLPKLVQGQLLQSHQAQLSEKHTQPPQAFTDASLLSAMTGISRYVKDPELRKVLKDTDGLGTEATRASIIELLFKRTFLTRQGRQIHATETGKALIQALPDHASQPDMTAHWESQLARISEKQLNYQGFMEPMQARLSALIHDARSTQLTPASDQASANFKGRKRTNSSTKKRSHQKKSSYQKRTANTKNASKSTGAKKLSTRSQSK